MLPAEHLRKVVDWARERGAVVASDECYLPLRLGGAARSRCSTTRSTGGDYTGVLAVHSLSKRSNLAGYRAGFVAGDPALVAEPAGGPQARRHDRARRRCRPRWSPRSATRRTWPPSASVYAARRDRAARRADQGRVRRSSHSEAGLYLWATRDEDCWQTVDWLAERGILAAPGASTARPATRHVRVALTATDERVPPRSPA